MNQMHQAFQLAGRKLGMNENEQNAALTEYMRNGGVNLDPAVTAWCAAFVNASLQQAGMQGTGSLGARSFMDWGQPVEQPNPGDIAVFRRDGPEGWEGHVGFFHSMAPDGRINVLGGNQGNAVSVAPYRASDLLGFRRAPGEYSLGEPQQQNALAPQQPEQPEPFRPQFNALDPRAFRSRRIDPNALAMDLQPRYLTRSA